MWSRRSSSNTGIANAVAKAVKAIIEAAAGKKKEKWLKQW